MTERERAAIHEGGHCAIAYRFHRSIRSVTIDDGGAGVTICGELNAGARHKFSPERYRKLAIEEVY